MESSSGEEKSCSGSAHEEDGSTSGSCLGNKGGSVEELDKDGGLFSNKTGC
jgi:hypothetical protein